MSPGPFSLSFPADVPGPVETFIIGAALSATSLGTTFVVISGATTGLDFVQTRVGIVLVSAALLDDIVGLIMVRSVSLPATRPHPALHPQ